MFIKSPEDIRRKALTIWAAHSTEIILLSFIAILGILLRLYKIADYMPFNGDEGRDMMAIKTMFDTRSIPLIGPGTSVGGMYLGPFYYFLIALPLRLFNYNPIAAAITVTFISMGSVFIVYYLTSQWFNKTCGYIAAFLYAISRVTVLLSRSSINTHPAPFFALLIVLGLYLVRKYKDYRWLILVGAAFGIIVQLHYYALLLAPLILGLYTYSIYEDKKIQNKKYFLQGSIGAAFAFIVVLLPFLKYELINSFPNLNAAQDYLTIQNKSAHLINPITKFINTYVYDIAGNHIAGNVMLLTYVIVFFSLIPIIYIFRKKKPNHNWAIWTIAIWLFLPLLVISYTNQPTGAHYFEFINPAVFILFAAGLSLSINFFKGRKGIFVGVFVSLLLATIFVVNLSKQEYFISSPSLAVERTKKVSHWISKDAAGAPFNIRLLPIPYDTAYWFYLDLYKSRPKDFSEDTKLFYLICPIKNCLASADSESLKKINTHILTKKEHISGITIFKYEH